MKIRPNILESMGFALVFLLVMALIVGTLSGLVVLAKLYLGQYAPQTVGVVFIFGFITYAHYSDQQALAAKQKAEKK